MKLAKKILSGRYIFNDEIIDKKNLHYNLLQDIIISVKKKNSRNLRNFCPACNSESAEIISPLSRFASFTANLVLPVAVGPSMVISSKD